ncbi:hypothetical protein SAMN05428945_1123 [Streptomyces sp. 2224.1]|uniref:hypothetical protein n=1 Tax=unclassified Streptomyces TaxID=2593676 RepID=UPI000882851E|nr:MULTISPECIES: hypothetical protein [unclassified Streptomyces]PBC84245.1 hypothetical protein BX261_4225 [Streptomyces sp. 2321.6]SDR33328.1 hypothetical protein SAMN05216511_2974 [Streptomyces sp. KS_16]SEB77334.1 hypothetical protein SAMN05428945_1123 [Streptomyces sp. 2224.1]SED24709.1 hypothetical protein SAMN05428940_4252 [Streptomyces sp. 2133.1]SEE57528.1 hypothetical protein SAMN05428954_3053 [Streptomyces sp. 2112.3]
MPRKHTPPERPTAQGRNDADEPTDGLEPVNGPALNTPDDEVDPAHERAADNDSEALTRLRARVHQDYARRQQYGPLGRSL